MLVEVGVTMRHWDVDVGHLDLVVVPQMLVLLLGQDDAPDLVIIPRCWTRPEVPEDVVIEGEVCCIPCSLIEVVVDVLDVHGCRCDVGRIPLDVEL